MTLSRMVMSSNVAGTWNVRPMPRSACCSAGARVTSTPLKRILPLVGSRSPATQLKNVDLPAPFGPIRPTISPSPTLRLASDKARRLPKARETFWASSSTRPLRLRPRPQQPPQARPHLVPKLDEPAGLEARQQHDDAAVEDVGQAAAAAAEPGVGGALHRHQDDGADDRPVERAGAAEGGGDDHLHRDEDTETALGIHKADLDRVERSRDRGQC